MTGEPIADVASFRTKIVAPPVPKAPPKEHLQNTGLPYPYPHMIIGTMIHFKTAQAIRGMAADTVASPNYVAFLDASSDTLVGTRLNEAVGSIANDLVDKVKQIQPDGQTTVWLPEVPIQPDTRQIQAIKDALEDKAILALARTAGFDTLDDLAKAAITNPDFSMGIQTDNGAVSSLTLATAMATARDVLKSDTSPSTAQKLSLFLASVSNYYYLDFTKVEWTRVEDIPDEYKRLVASASARVDLIGLSAQKGSPEEEFIKHMPEVFQGNFFGYTPLLDFVSPDTEKVEKQLKLLELIRLGKVKLNIVELKTQIQTKAKKGGDYVPVAYHPETVAVTHYEDVGHTIFTLTQYLTRLANLPHVKDGSDYSSLLAIMDVSPGQKSQVIAQVLRDMRPIVDNTDFYLARVYWPIIDPQGAKPPLFGLKPDLEAGSQIAVNPMNKRKVRHAVVKNGARMVRQILENPNTQ